VLEMLRSVYHHDALARGQELSPRERLRFHQEHSGPAMKELHEWMTAQLAEHKTELNSGLGKAISYLLNPSKTTIYFSLCLQSIPRSTHLQGRPRRPAEGGRMDGDGMG